MKRLTVKDEGKVIKVEIKSKSIKAIVDYFKSDRFNQLKDLGINGAAITADNTELGIKASIIKGTKSMYRVKNTLTKYIEKNVEIVDGTVRAKSTTRRRRRSK